MNKKGFTLVEILSVIVILGMLSTIALVSVSRYRKVVDEKEIINIHETLEDSYMNYRVKKTFTNQSVSNLTFQSSNTSNKNDYNKFFGGISYSGDRIAFENIEELSFDVHIKGELLNKSNYIKDAQTEEQYIKDGVCAVENEYNTSEQEVTNKCKKTDGTILGSQEELICIFFQIKDENGTKKTIIDDKTDTNSLCHYLVN